MKLAKLILSTVLVFSTIASQAATPVQFDLEDVRENSLPGVRIRITPKTTPDGRSGRVLGNDFFETVTGSDGTVTTNLVWGDYDVSYLWTNKTTTIRIRVPDTNVTQSAGSLMTTNGSAAGATQTYTTQVADGIFVKKTNSFAWELQLSSTNSPGPAVGQVWTMTGTNGAGAWSNAPAGSGGGGTTNAISTVRSNATSLTASATELRLFNFTKLTNAAGVISLEQDVSTATLTTATNNLYALITNGFQVTSNGLVVYVDTTSNALSARLLGTNTALLTQIGNLGTAVSNYAAGLVVSYDPGFYTTNGGRIFTKVNARMTNPIISAGQLDVPFITNQIAFSQVELDDTTGNFISRWWMNGNESTFYSAITGAKWMIWTQSTDGLRLEDVTITQRTNLNVGGNIAGSGSISRKGVSLLPINFGANLTATTNADDVTVTGSAGGGGGTGIQTNFGTGLSNTFTYVNLSNETHNGSYSYATYSATLNLDWSLMSREITINSNTTFTLSNTNLSTEFSLKLNNTASTNIVVTLPAGVISVALQTNAQITVSALTTNFWYFLRDTNNLIWLTVNGPSTTAAASGGGAGITFDSIRNANYIMFDDFQESSGSGSATWGPFHFIRNNGGTGAIGDAAGTTNAPGIARLSTGTTAASWVAFYNYSSGGTAPYLIRGSWTNEVRFRLNSLQNAGTDTYRFFCGYGNSTSSAEPTEGAYLRYDTNDTHFVYITTTSAGSLKTTNATTLTPVAATWYKFRSVLNITGSTTNVTFTIDDAQSTTYTGSNSIPSGAVVGLDHSLFKLTGTTSLSADFDYVALAPWLPVSR